MLYDLAASLVDPSTPRRLQLDDAVGLPDDAVPAFSGDHQLADGYVALSFSPIGGELEDAYLDAVAAFASRLHERSGLPMAFVSNVGGWTGEPAGDVAVGEALRGRLGSGARLVDVPLLPARQAAALLRAARRRSSAPVITLSSSASAPRCRASRSLRIATRRSSSPARLAPAGMAGWCFPLEMLASDLAGDLVDEFWDRRDELVAHLATATAPWPSLHRAHWDELWQALTTAAALPVERVYAEAATIDVSPKVAGIGASASRLLGASGSGRRHRAPMGAGLCRRGGVRGRSRGRRW